ncbi:TetR/AcrR family transcriptional regulator [Mycolicibacterium sediminis]|uniref:HTH tetR-type domain-containing protein n=1 Tax=Mycolicibacterium sediminis TaxID=1286180 RepID=A0A7I7QS79_9MYCO|nr:TetR family transcriptional regulator [Mycolicibacterium sediminis]BBY29082.1 hypothetical protein MSEDJ_31780 [Mycolicibacterium sediminis]
MSSSRVAHVTRIRDPHARHASTHRRVLGAAAQLLDESARPDVSVPELAARARVAQTAVRAHFPSMDAVFAELYLQQVTALPLTVDTSAPVADRVATQLSAVALILADRPGLAHASTAALLSTGDPAVAAARARIAAEVRRRLGAALGTGAWPEVLDTLETLFWGALLRAQSREIDYRAMAERLATMVSLVVPEDDD